MYGACVPISVQMTSGLSGVLGSRLSNSTHMNTERIVNREPKLRTAMRRRF
jgi:cation transporter-like permease